VAAPDVGHMQATLDASRVTRTPDRGSENRSNRRRSHTSGDCSLTTRNEITSLLSDRSVSSILFGGDFDR